ncbi:hypothetical protein GUITHDRAFT_142658 [Guillardia theta CCMP2712]|uniref:histone acetyltransferase n=1 Tax=Guillardia theta (strain CCMP2712) TaxID=905079 RepID=L1IWB0_GUITC|nr:hypothetical protein GUITHDRAFT_142658 [Guillardia theta CCMP2712]EKX40553.1 hypothetical protein GUITHDRAFT_142658 [Guillardia theta CCMP2712]|eukprot:XP_005827533.1 hypothetical protein GUITHDRAFT_142658 [Guillardia theta CCMP2712]
MSSAWAARSRRTHGSRIEEEIECAEEASLEAFAERFKGYQATHAFQGEDTVFGSGGFLLGRSDLYQEKLLDEIQGTKSEAKSGTVQRILNQKVVFLKVTKVYKNITLPKKSWFPVTVTQVSRIKTIKKYLDEDEDILSLESDQSGVSCTMLVEEVKGWVLLRLDTGEEGWYPAAFVKSMRRFIEIEGEQEKVLVGSGKRIRRQTDRLSPTWSSDDESKSAAETKVVASTERISTRNTKVDSNEDEWKDPCAMCFNPAKKLGNAKTIALICSRCEGIIKQGWPFWQHCDPPEHEPGHPVSIVNMCIYCFQVVQRDGMYTPPKEETEGAKVAAPPDEAKSKVILATEFTSKVVEQDVESMCECPFCGRKYHDRCVRYNREMYGDIPPRCIHRDCQDKWNSLAKPQLNCLYLNLRARDMKESPLSQHMQSYVAKKVFKGLEKSCPVIIRTVSNVKRMQESTPGFTARFGKQNFPYLLKNIMCFVECEDETDVAFLGLVVAEFGSDAPEPNKNKAYISYIDSVQLYHKASCCLRGRDVCSSSTCSDPEECTRERKEVVRRVLLGYLDAVKKRGFEALFIWSMPPNDLHHDYIFHMRPLHQHCPTPAQLDSWYAKLLNVAKQEGIITDWDSNARRDEDGEQDRSLPRSLFGPDMSLRHVPQFPGGLMLRALEAALSGGDAKLTSSATPSRPETSKRARAEVTPPADSGPSRSEGRRISRELTIQSHERHQRAVEAMNKYMQRNSEMGSIFMVQYSKDKAGSGKSKSSSKHREETLEEDPLVNVDEDKHEFTLNECAHLCTLLNDLHLQFNDMRHGKFSTMMMIHRLVRQLLIKSESLKKAHPAPATVRGRILDVADALLHRLGGSSGSVRQVFRSTNGASPKDEIQRGGSKEWREESKLWKAMKRASHHVSEETEDSVRELTARQRRNLNDAADAAASHKCNSRCADGKCNKYDWEFACPVVCRWQHTCCMREDPLVCFDEAIEARDICYDTDYNYMCHLCSAMPQVVAIRSKGRHKDPIILRKEPLKRKRGRPPIRRDAEETKKREEDAKLAIARSSGSSDHVRPYKLAKTAGSDGKAGGEESKSREAQPPSARGKKKRRGYKFTHIKNTKIRSKGEGAGREAEEAVKETQSSGKKARKREVDAESVGDSGSRRSSIPGITDKDTRDEIYLSRFEHKTSKSRFFVGQNVECEDRGAFYQAEIKSIDNSLRTQRVLVHFKGWSIRYDVWLAADSSRAFSSQSDTFRKDTDEDPAGIRPLAESKTS